MCPNIKTFYLKSFKTVKYFVKIVPVMEGGVCIYIRDGLESTEVPDELILIKFLRDHNQSNSGDVSL